MTNKAEMTERESPIPARLYCLATGYTVAPKSTSRLFDQTRVVRGVFMAFRAMCFPTVATCCALANAALAVAVCKIFRLCAEPKMGRIYTGRHIAGMANILAVWDWANIQQITESMRGKLLSVVPNSSVSEREYRTSPEPTGETRNALSLSF